MGSRLSSHATQPDDYSDDEILLVAPPPPPPLNPPTVPSNNRLRKALLNRTSSEPNAAATPAKRPRVKPPAEQQSPFLPPPLLDRKQHSAPRPSSAKVGIKSATKRTLDGSPPSESLPSRRKRQHTRWTDDTATGGTIASISYANKMRSAAAQPSPPHPEKEVVPDVAAATASASLASTTTRTTPTPKSVPTPSKTKRKRVRSPSFELEIFNPPPSRRRATLSAPIPPSANPAPPPPPPPPRSVPTTSFAVSVAVLAPARSTVSPDEPNDSNEQRGPPANKEVPPASTASRSKGVGDSPLSRRATQAVIRPFDLVAPLVKMHRQSAGSSSGSGSTSSPRPSPPPAGKKSLPSAQTPTPLPFPHKSPSHPLNASLRLKPNPSAPPPPIPVRFLRNDEFEATRGLGGWVMPHPVAAPAAAAAAKGSSLSRPSSRSSTPLPATATANATARKGAAAARVPAATALSFADWARKRYGFLDPAETSHYKIDGTTLGIDPDVMSFEWDEDELWDAYEERWGWRERERVARGEEGASEEESEEEEEEDNDDTDDDDDEGKGSDSGLEEHQKRSSPPPPRARMAFTSATATSEDGAGEDTIAHGTEIVARLCHLASAAEGAVHPSDRLSALSQLDAMSRQGAAVFQVPWRWKSLEEGQGRASNLAGMVDGKGKWATRNPFMRGTAEEEGKSGRGAHRFAKVSATAAVASMQGAGTAGSRPRAAAAQRRTLLSSSTSTSSSRASSVDLNPIDNVVSAAAAASSRPVPAAPPAPLNVAAVTGALYGIDNTHHAALGSDMTGFDSVPAPRVPPVPAPARQIPHLGTFFLSPSSASSSPRPVAAASATMRLETSSEGAAVIRSIHDISNANATSPLLSGGVAPGLSNPSKRGAATASSTIESSRILPSRPLRPEKPPMTVRSLAGVASASTSCSSFAATSASSSAKEYSSSTTSSDRDESGPTSANSSGPEAGPLTARDVHPPPPPPSAPVGTVRPLAPPVVPAPPHPTAPAASSANGSRTLAAKPSAETPQKPPTVKRATTPSGMVRCNHGGCPSPFYHPQKRAALENHARNFHTPGVTLNYRDPDRAHYLERDPKSGALNCPFCSFWSMNASSTRQHVYRRSDCLGPPVRSRTG